MYLQQCITCGKQYHHKEFLYTCPDCGDLKGTLDILYDYESLKKTLTKSGFLKSPINSIFRYLPLLPLAPGSALPGLKVGMTPIFQYPDIARESAISKLTIKDESYHPSLSLKDRASAVALLKAKELKFQIAATASTGNAAASMACIGAHLNMETFIFVPKSIPRAKLIQLQIFGATILMVDGNYDDAFDLCREISLKKKWYNRSTAINPYNLEGKKTAAFEICEHFNFSVPDLIFVPVGDGCIISALWKGFKDFYQVGLIERLPRLVACQAAGSAAIYQAFKNHHNIPQAIKANTIADSISVDLPRDGIKAIRSLVESEGDAVLVSDDQILHAQQRLAREKGIFCEPSAAAAFAGFLNFVQSSKGRSTDEALVLLTGSGMKDLASAEKGIEVKKLITFDPENDDIEENLKENYGL
jgi:threonine synthase